MHKDRGWWHSLSVFVCLERRRVRFGCPGRDDFVVTMEAGDVLVFNGNVWHSGLQNADSSAVLFYYFDMDPFAIDHERVRELFLGLSFFCDPKITAFFKIKLLVSNIFLSDKVSEFRQTVRQVLSFF